MDKSLYYTKSDLKGLGWTDGAITSFLNEPDATAPNPYSKKSPPVKLFSRDRVNQAMQSEEFIIWHNKGQLGRKAASNRMKKLMAEKRAALIKEIVEHLKIYWQEDETLEMLVQAAMRHWKDHNEYRELSKGNYNISICEPQWTSDTSFLSRITKNYVRHVRSNYENLLQLLTKQVGKDDAYHELKEEIDRQISAKFGSISNEIEKVKASKGLLLQFKN